MACLWGKNGPNRTISGGQTPFSAQVHFLACPWALPLAFLLSFFDCSQRFRSRGQVFLMFRLLREPRRRGPDQAGVAYVPATLGATSTRAWTDVAYVPASSGVTSTRTWAGVSLMFRLLRVLFRREHGQTVVAYVPATSGATSTRSWTGRRRLCSSYFGCDIDNGVDRQTLLPEKPCRRLSLAQCRTRRRKTKQIFRFQACCLHGSTLQDWPVCGSLGRRARRKAHEDVAVHGRESKGFLYTLCLFHC